MSILGLSTSNEPRPAGNLTPLQNLEVALLQLENPDHKSGSEDADFAHAQSSLEMYLRTSVGGAANGLSLPKLLNDLPRLISASPLRRNAALIIARCIGVDASLIHSDGANSTDYKVVEFLESAIPDLLEFVSYDKSLQTYERVNNISTLLTRVRSIIEPIRTPLRSQEDAESSLTAIQKALNSKLAKGFLNPFGFEAVASHIRAIATQLQKLSLTAAESLPSQLERIRRLIDEARNDQGVPRSFLSLQYFAEYLNNAENYLHRLEQEARGQFNAVIECLVKAPGDLQRRYPLHKVDQWITISVPFRNQGPGKAREFAISATVEGADGVLIDEEERLLGDLSTGEFSIAFELCATERVASIKLKLKYSWGIYGDANRRTAQSTIRILPQRADVDWERLSRFEPYSLEVAEGHEFVGRSAKVLKLSALFLKPRMGSCYIYGQKRVGKTSLAKAVMSNIIAQGGASLAALYLEYGDYANPDPVKTVCTLGARIERFLLKGSDAPLHQLNDFSGSLSILSDVADDLLIRTPDRKFVIVLDEFDEIHPDLYRLGSLADTFFQNLRSLSTKKNLAFMLVGGENMPYIISAQGDQLNKFVAERLDYFSGLDDWSDYIELVREPTNEDITWTEPAIRKLFNLTSGHPYYTKAICQNAFSDAVRLRDCEIDSAEIVAASDQMSAYLDANAFMHFWKDGIFEREKSEEISGKRCKTLIAIGRTMRDQASISPIEVDRRKGPSTISVHEIEAILQDFVRRGVLRLTSTGLQFSIPFFAKWLETAGVTLIVTDKLGEELATKQQAIEDSAYVQSNEIQELVARWGVYRSRSITCDDVRTWLGQVNTNIEQRLLFKILTGVKFFTRERISELLFEAYNLVSQHVTTFVKVTKRYQQRERRRDLAVVYIDGEGKSGALFASLYAERNDLLAASVMSAAHFRMSVDSYEKSQNISINAVVIIDDIAGTGSGLTENLQQFVADHATWLSERSAPIIVVVMTGTPEAQIKLDEFRQKAWQQNRIKVEFRICDPLTSAFYAFDETSSLWASEEERDAARSLAFRIGTSLYPSAPLGFGDKGLLVIFPDNCPNNSLPILHASSGSTTVSWKPLFPRSSK